MACTERLRLDPFLADALPAGEAEAFEAHLDQCSSCWEEFLGRQVTGPDLGLETLAEPAALPPDFTRNVLRRVEAERPTKAALLWPWLQGRWALPQFASVAYAMCATLVVVSARNLLFLWGQDTSWLDRLSLQGAVYRDVLAVYLALPTDYLGSFWHGLSSWITLR